MTKNILVADKLTKKYGDKQVVKGVSFSVRRGEAFGILGPNGAGKTTTLEMIETLRPIDSGSATIDGVDVAENAEAIRQVIGVQTQSSAFYDRVSLREQLQLLISIYDASTSADTLLEEVGLTEKASDFPEKLSGGQK